MLSVSTGTADFVVRVDKKLWVGSGLFKNCNSLFGTHDVSNHLKQQIDGIGRLPGHHSKHVITSIDGAINDKRFAPTNMASFTSKGADLWSVKALGNNN